MMKKMLSALLALAMILTLAVPAVAANDSEKKLTYDERVANLKTNYSVTFGKARNPATWTVTQRDASIRCVEEAVMLLGSRATHTIAKHWINANGQFGIYAGIDMDESEWNPLAFGYHSNGRINFIIPGASDTPGNYDIQYRGEMLKFTSELEYQTMYLRNILVHEIGHAYDFGLLKNAGGRAMAAINGKYDMAATGWEANYAFAQSRENASEDFSTTFDLMLTSTKPIREISIWTNNYQEQRMLNSKDKLYKKCEAVYELILRDFGAGSGAAKRAAKFLGKELPKEK